MEPSQYTKFHLKHYMSWKTCAGDYENEISSRNLKCRYNHHNSPFLLIAPLKEEILSLVPKLSIFRDAVYDSEIELLKTNAEKVNTDEVNYLSDNF